jgi:hypothetical protein
MSKRAGWTIVIVAAGIAALLVVLDRVGLRVAERIAADTIESSQHLNSRPGVEIAGFPFLNQLATGKYDKVTITADDVAVGRPTGQLVLSRVRLVLHSLTVSRDFRRLHAARADAAATITYRELGSTLGVALSYAGGGRVRAAKTVTVAGVTVNGAVTARPRLAGGALSFSDPAVDEPRGLGAAGAAALRRLFDVTVPLNGVGFDVRARSLHADAEGLTLALTGRDLTYAR